MTDKSLDLVAQEPVQPKSPGKPNRKQSPLDIVIGILKKTSRQRTEKDLEQLVPLIKTIAFFIERDIKDEDYYEIVSCLTYELFKPGDIVFDWGSLGDKFYIILQGTVKVLIPNPTNKESIAMIDESNKQVDAIQQQLKVLQKQIDEEKKQKEEMEKALKEQQELENTQEESMSTVSRRSPISRRRSFRKSPLKQAVQPPSPPPPKHTSSLYPQGTLQIQQSKPKANAYKHSTATQVGIQMDLLMNKKSLFNQVNSAKNILNDDAISEDQSDSEYTNSKSTLKTKVKELTLEQKKQMLIYQIQKIKEQTEETYFMEVVQLKTGKSFGELALIKNKPRAATIKCVEQCHLAVMNKQDYQKVLQRIEQKNLNKILDFLNMLPFLQSWSRNALVKLQYAFETKTYMRNSIIYKEGEPSHFVYIIKEGEFELQKRVKPNKGEGSIGGGVEQLLKIPQNMEVKKENTSEISSFRDFIKNRGKSIERSGLGSLQTSQQLELVPKKKKVFDEKLVSLANTSKVISKEQQAKALTSNSFQIAQIGVGQLFGEEDVISDRNYSCSVVCKSKVGEVFAIKSEEFIKKFKGNQESWGVIVLMSMAKEKAIFARVKKIRQLLKASDDKGSNGGYGLSLLRETQLLLNQNEMDLRQRFKEIIEEYPSVDNHRKLLQVNQNAIKEKETHIVENSKIKNEVKPLRKTIEVSFDKKQNLPEITQFKNQKRSLSPVHKPTISTSITNAKQTYISSKVSDLLQNTIQNKDIPKSSKHSPKVSSPIGALLAHQESFSKFNTSIIIQPKQNIGSQRNSLGQLMDQEEKKTLSKNQSKDQYQNMNGIIQLNSPKYLENESRNQGTNFIISERSRSNSSSHYNTQPNFTKQDSSFQSIPPIQIAPVINHQAYLPFQNRPSLVIKKKQGTLHSRLNKSLQGVGSPIEMNSGQNQMINVVEYSSFHPNSFIKQNQEFHQGQRKKPQGSPSLLTDRQRYMSVAFTLNPLNPLRLKPTRNPAVKMVSKRLKKQDIDEPPHFSNHSIQMFTPKIYNLAEDVLQMIREKKEKQIQLEVRGESRLAEQLL